MRTAMIVVIGTVGITQECGPGRDGSPSAADVELDQTFIDFGEVRASERGTRPLEVCVSGGRGNLERMVVIFELVEGNGGFGPSQVEIAIDDPEVRVCETVSASFQSNEFGPFEGTYDVFVNGSRCEPVRLTMQAVSLDPVPDPGDEIPETEVTIELRNALVAGSTLGASSIRWTSQTGEDQRVMCTEAGQCTADVDATEATLSIDLPTAHVSWDPSGCVVTGSETVPLTVDGALTDRSVGLANLFGLPVTCAAFVEPPPCEAPPIDVVVLDGAIEVRVAADPADPAMGPSHPAHVPGLVAVYPLPSNAIAPATSIGYPTVGIRPEPPLLDGEPLGCAVDADWDPASVDDSTFSLPWPSDSCWAWTQPDNAGQTNDGWPSPALGFPSDDAQGVDEYVYMRVRTDDQAMRCTTNDTIIAVRNPDLPN
ncbi:MAG: hypothetical protein AAF602_23330 [Myxococcota bacterium]